MSFVRIEITAGRKEDFKRVQKALTNLYATLEDIDVDYSVKVEKNPEIVKEDSFPYGRLQAIFSAFGIDEQSFLSFMYSIDVSGICPDFEPGVSRDPYPNDEVMRKVNQVFKDVYVANPVRDAILHMLEEHHISFKEKSP